MLTQFLLLQFVADHLGFSTIPDDHVTQLAVGCDAKYTRLVRVCGPAEEHNVGRAKIVDISLHSRADQCDGDNR